MATKESGTLAAITPTPGCLNPNLLEEGLVEPRKHGASVPRFVHRFLIKTQPVREAASRKAARARELFQQFSLNRVPKSVPGARLGAPKAMTRWRDAGCSGNLASLDLHGARSFGGLRPQQLKNSWKQNSCFPRKEACIMQRTRALCLQPPGYRRARRATPPGRHLHRMRHRENSTHPHLLTPCTPTSPDLRRRPQVSDFLSASFGGCQPDLSIWRLEVARSSVFPSNFL